MPSQLFTLSSYSSEKVRSASDWVAIMSNEGCTESSREGFYAWLEESPENLDCYLELCAIYGAGVDNPSDTSVGFVRNLHARDRRAPARRERVLYALAASVVGVAVLTASVVLLINQKPQIKYANGEASPKSVTLSDGTLATLDASTVLMESFDKDHRLVTLLLGRVAFDVDEDDARPFHVAAGSVVIQDIGTMFQASLSHAGEVDVAVKEGSVNVDRHSYPDVMVGAGYRVRVVESTRLAVPQPIDRNVDFDWTSGFLVFSDKPLGDVVAEMNKYSTAKIILGSDATSEIRVNGAFHAGDQNALVAALSEGWRLSRRDTPDGSIVLTVSQ